MQVLDLNAEEQAILRAPDRDVEQWLARAHAGHADARDTLCVWAFVTASAYYHAKVRDEVHLDGYDVEELAVEFFLEFEQALPRMRTATRFARRLLKQKLKRYLQKKNNRRQHEVPLPRLDHSHPPAGDERTGDPWVHWSDAEWHQYQATLQVLRETDDLTRSIVERRTTGMAYVEIAREMNLSEASLRMRVARFYRSVRDRYDRLIR